MVKIEHSIVIKTAKNDIVFSKQEAEEVLQALAEALNKQVSNKIDNQFFYPNGVRAVNHTLFGDH